MSTLKTRRRYSMCGGDFSSQEVRMFTANTEDPGLIQVFKDGKDLYSEMASRVYNLPYDECREFRSDGTFNLEGKARRNRCKSLVLGIMYQRGVKSIAEQIKANKELPATKEDVEEAKSILEGFFKSYPKAKEWMEGNKAKAHKLGYVEDLWGRRRRLPDASLPKYEFSLLTNETELSNPLLGTSVKKIEPNKRLIAEYTNKLDKARTKEARDVICAEALKDGLKITCNSGYIAQAERQAINAPIQGGSATMTKLAMRNMYRDELLNELDFHLLIPVHDEVIGEAPLWNIEQAKDRMSYLMIHAGEPECKVPMKADADVFNGWYFDVMKAHVVEEYEKAIADGKSEDEAVQVVHNENCEFTEEVIRKFIFEDYQ